jgi:elongation factor 1-gamma
LTLNRFLQPSNSLRTALNLVANGINGTTLFGKTKKDAALVAQFISVADNEFNPIVAAWIYPILGYFPPNDAAIAKAKADCQRALGALNQHLLTRTFLVSEHVTLADISMVCAMIALFKLVLDPSFVGAYKNVVRWFTTCINQPHFKSVLGTVELCTKMQVPPKVEKAKTEKPSKEAKKEKAPKKEKTASKEPSAESLEEDLEAIAAAEQKPAAKNPLDLLPKSTFVLDEWKRTYSNNDTRPVAIDWFWANYDQTGYSIWKVDYKYNSELTQIFMSSNLVGGFFQRLDRARKYAFGSVLVLGEDKKNVITGHFVFRGHEIPFEVTDAADYDSYSFTRINDQDPAAREAFNACIAWDETIDGKPCADGKVFK